MVDHVCPIGRYCDPGVGSPALCPVGTYNPSKGVTAVSVSWGMGSVMYQQVKIERTALQIANSLVTLFRIIGRCGSVPTNRCLETFWDAKRSLDVSRSGSRLTRSSLAPYFVTLDTAVASPICWKNAHARGSQTGSPGGMYIYPFTKGKHSNIREVSTCGCGE